MSHEQHHLLGNNANHPNVNISGELKGDVLWHNGEAWTRLEKGTSGHFLKISGENVTWATTGGAGNQSLFETISADSGTSPVADTTTDTLNIAGGTAIKTAGDSANDRVSISFSISGEVAGDIPYKTAATWTRRSAGSQNQFLRQGAGNVPEWANVVSGEKLKISNTDPIADHLINKIAAGSNVTITKSNSVSGELLTIASTGGGGTLTIQEDDATVGGGSFSTIDFLGKDFNVTESPTNEANVSINVSGEVVGTASVQTLSSKILITPRIANFNNGSVLFASGENIVSQDNSNFYWDILNKKLDIDALGINGTAGKGYIEMIGQSAQPVTLPAGSMMIHASTSNGFTRPEYHNESLEDIVIGQDSIFLAKNTSGGIVTKGQPVYVTGSTGSVPNISLAKADLIATSRTVIGISVETSIANNSFGLFMLTGVLDSVDTSSFASGDILYVSETTAGGLTNTSPTYPNYQKSIGTVLNSGVGNGSILVNIAPFLGGTESGTTAASFIFGGKVGIGATTFGTGATSVLALLNGATPSTSPANMVQLYSFSGELRCRNESGTIIILNASGEFVGTTQAQILTNKTLTTPTIGSFTNAGHNHTNAANGGQIVSGETGRSKVTGNDTTLGYISGKLTAGSGIVLTINNAGANESLDIATSGGGAATITVQESDVTLGSGSFNTVDFNGNDFAVTELPSGEANVSIDYTNAQSASPSTKGFLTAVNYTTFADFSGNHTKLSGEHVTNGNTHDHNGGDGAQINHTTLSNIGSNAHSILDAHLTYTTTHGVSGEIVGTTSTQTLTNKTLTTPTIANLTNMTHNHSNASNGGASVSHLNLTNIGSNAHTVLDAHLTYTTTHGVSGEIVGTTSTQTLTNKTLTTPTVGDLTNMNHAHSGVASGGQVSHLNLTNIGSNAHSILDAHLTYTTTHGVSGEIAGTTSTQTLTNKTLTTPTIGSFTNSIHNHQNAAGGGQIISGENGRARVSGNDLTLGYLNGKLVAGTNITLTENGDGANETLTIAATGGAGTQNLFETISADSGTSAVADSTTDTLNIAGGTAIKTAGDSANDRITISLSVSGEVAGDTLYRTASTWTRLPSGEANQFYQQGASSVPRWKAIQQTANIGIVVDGGGSAITIGKKGNIVIPWNCTIDSATLLADQTGSIVIDVWRESYANYPPSGEDSICAAAKPTISASNKAQDTTLTGWSTSLLKGQVLGFNVDSVATVMRVSVNLGVTKT